MFGKGINLQDQYLNQLRKEKIPVIIFLTNGVRLKGLIKAFDNLSGFRAEVAVRGL